ncbi:uncharacterized protein TRIREDRAFT_108852 [Trichoderma reesei QM6a]|uniref:Predicted protein n=1 Tax=Hypocrea jecorina (strain QM6a) TaxID=431241 RepID=G0RMX7_HYPJQ|nr:uncharacterized protein TRIREDRAFT_108852 [Trichoderma reesei QM6a]EGR47562.1 predicted protein [Trichoderma reesei QM6a]
MASKRAGCLFRCGQGMKLLHWRCYVLEGHGELDMGAVLAAVMGLPRMPRANAHKTDVMMYTKHRLSERHVMPCHISPEPHLHLAQVHEYGQTNSPRRPILLHDLPTFTERWDSSPFETRVARRSLCTGSGQLSPLAVDYWDAYLKVWHPAETHSLIAGPDDRQGFDKFSPLLKATELYPCPPRGNVEEKRSPADIDPASPAARILLSLLWRRTPALDKQSYLHVMSCMSPEPRHSDSSSVTVTEICIAEGAMAEQADYMPIYDVVITKHLLRGGSHVSLSTIRASRHPRAVRLYSVCSLSMALPRQKRDGIRFSCTTATHTPGVQRVRLKRRVQKGPAAVASFTVRSRQLHRQRLAQESKADARGHVNHDCSRIIVLAQSPRMHEAVMILLPQLRAPSARGAQLHDFSALERTGPWRKLDPVPRGWISTETRLTILRVLSLSLSLSLFPTPSNPCAHGCLTMHNAGITVDAQQRAASLPFPPLGRSEVALSDESGLGRPLTQRDRCKDPRSHGRDHLTMGPGPKVESCHARRAADLVKPYAPQRLGRADKIYAVICITSAALG